jgi:hypothetical protein
MMNNTCYLVGQFQFQGDTLQLSFLPNHPTNSDHPAIGLWQGQGARGDGCHKTPAEALEFEFFRMDLKNDGTWQRIRFERGLEYHCREAGCLWFLDFVRRLVEGTAVAGDFLAEFRRHNNGAEPRSDAQYYVFL